jgi:predicted transposase/invertase (TIGR01784 family)
MSKKIIPLSNDLIFKAIFGTDEEILFDLLNSFSCFEGNHKIENIQILNPEIPKNATRDKIPILDILAKDKQGNKFLIEMQSRTDTEFKQRILFYWSTVYSKAIGRGNSFKELPKVYSFNFVKGILFPDSNYHEVFRVKNESNKIHLTGDLEIHTIELGKFTKQVEELETELEAWLLLIKKAELLKGGEMKTLTKKNPKTKKAVTKLKFVSYNPKNEYHVLARKMAEFDEASRKVRLEELKEKVREEGKLEGIKEGIEKGKLEMAIKLLKTGMDISIVSEISGLSEKEIVEYRNKNSIS